LKQRTVRKKERPEQRKKERKMQEQKEAIRERK
jgi:hypothetical protein